MKYRKRYSIAAAVCIVLALPVVIFFSREPVLVITDAPFAALYGVERIQWEQRLASLVLFRRVIPVMVADGAGPDIIIVAVSEASSRPGFVVFPRHHAGAAERLRQDFPEIRSILIGGRVNSSRLLYNPDTFFHIYTTDSGTDLYRAGLIAGLLANMTDNPVQEDETLTLALWGDPSINSGYHELFSQGVREQNPDISIIIAQTLEQIPQTGTLSGVVITGSGGAEYFNRNTPIPVILFSWLDPALTSREVAVQFDDSSWGLVIPAVRMAEKGEIDGVIPSKVLIISGKVADNGILRMARRAAKKNQ